MYFEPFEQTSTKSLGRPPISSSLLVLLKSVSSKGWLKCAICPDFVSLMILR